MTLETITPEKYRLSEPSTSVDICDLGEAPSFCTPVSAAIQQQDHREPRPEKASPQNVGLKRPKELLLLF